jgi:hypothetical protein
MSQPEQAVLLSIQAADIGEDCVDLFWCRPKFQHIGMPCQNAFRKRLLQRIDRVAL